MNFTVLGAAGFIGRHLLAHLTQQGHEVWAPDKAAPEIFSRPLGHVFYCIGLTADFRQRPFETVRAHVGILADVLQRSSFDSLVYLSSTRIYARSQMTNEQALLTVNPNDPSDLYNLSKLTGESLCHSCGRSGVKVARLANVVGEDLQSSNFIFDLIRESLAGSITLQLHPDSCKDYLWIDDAVDLLVRVAVSGKSSVYNVASGINLRHRDLAECLARLTGARLCCRDDAPLIEFPSIDTRRIVDEFSFVPQRVVDRLPTLIQLFAGHNARLSTKEIS